MVEQVLLRRAADHVKVDHLFRLGGEVRADRRTGPSLGTGAAEGGERRAAEQMAALLEKPSPCESETEFVDRMHVGAYLQSTSSQFISSLPSIVHAARAAISSVRGFESPMAISLAASSA